MNDLINEAIQLFRDILTLGKEQFVLKNLPLDIRRKCRLHDNMIEKARNNRFDAITNDEFIVMLESNGTFGAIARPGVGGLRWLDVTDVTDRQKILEAHHILLNENCPE